MSKGSPEMQEAAAKLALLKPDEQVKYLYVKFGINVEEAVIKGELKKSVGGLIEFGEFDISKYFKKPS